MTEQNKSILQEAVQDMKDLRKACEENAKNLLVEAMSPKLKEFIQNQLGEDGVKQAMELETALEHDFERQNDIEKMPHTNDTKEGAGMYEMTPPDEDGPAGDPEKKHEEPDGDEDVQIKVKKEVQVPQMEGSEIANEAKDKEDGCAGDMEESVEITTEDLRKAFVEVLKQGLKEADVSKGFPDMQDPDKGDTGLAEKNPKETPWGVGEGDQPNYSEDWTVKEGKYKSTIKKLQEELTKYTEAFKMLRKNLNEMNLFNAKLVYTTKLLQNNLSNKQKMSIVESIDGAKNKREVELIYKTLSESLKIAGVLLSESAKKAPVSPKDDLRGIKGPKASRFTKPGSTTLTEGREAGNPESNRWTFLAGLME